MKKILCKKVLVISVGTVIAFGNLTWSVSQASKLAKQREIESFEQETVKSSELEMAE
ncbi:hypothetical protein ACFY5J_21235 [Peribacillus butanolivorans]|uniref:hypothetical protein n=1 Tax=Peribacillus TaxID=2675229 RepID=UPI000A8C585A|nr:hypothetical protein [Peribacillus butanolivorans]MCO0597612.1 hypothetical protein [Peribacillus butanolivorans]MED3690304.1 hypothetical protein [Peribacillus butanolivorans]QNU02990.1 hypothetical protein GM240_02750 [Peribacillus butanolivorans]